MANPHQPETYTWEIVNQAGDVVTSTVITSSAIPWPDLEVDLCQLALGADAAWGTPDHYMPREEPINDKGGLPWDDSNPYPGCNNKWARSQLAATAIYVCPGPHRPQTWTKRCGPAHYYYCAS